MSDNKDSDIDQVKQGSNEQDLEKIELIEKKDGKGKEDNDGKKAKTADESTKKGDEESPMSKAFCFSKYITFW